jgi:hypothetical protein
MLFTQNTKAAASAGTAFDGTWAVTADFHENKNPDGTMALAAVKHFPAKVKDGILHGKVGPGDSRLV